MIRAADYQAGSDERDANVRRLKAGEEPCFLCGLPLRTTTDRSVRLTTAGELAPIDVEPDPSVDQGWFRIGPECAKKLPAGYVTRKPHRVVPQDRYLEALRELPSGGELASFAELFDVSEATARRKLDGLVAQGIAERLPAQGFGPIYRAAP